MKLVYCLSIVSSLLIICGGTTWPWPWPTSTTTITTETTTTRAPIPDTTTQEPVTNITTGAPYSTTKAPTNITTQAPTNVTTQGPSPNTTTHAPTSTTTKAPITNTTHRYTTTGGSGLNLKGKMITVSQSSEVTLYPPNYFKFPPPESRTTTSKNRFELRYPRTTTARTTTPRPTPATRGVSVCLRFMVDCSSVPLFKLDPDYSKSLSFSLNDQSYTLGRDSYHRYVSLKPFIPLWSSVQPQAWTSVCVLLDSYKNVVQVFEGGVMSVRKITSPVIQWSGTPVVTVSGFDGQVTDLEVWDYPLENSEIFNFMQNYRATGTVLTWSNIAYQSNGDILMEDTYALGQSQPLRSRAREEQPIRSKQGRGQRHKYRKTLSGRRQRKRQIL